MFKSYRLVLANNVKIVGRIRALCHGGTVMLLLMSHKMISGRIWRHLAKTNEIIIQHLYRVLKDNQHMLWTCVANYKSTRS